MIPLEAYYTEEECEQLQKKYKRKKHNAKKRGISFTLTWEEYLLFGKKLLGHGVCDYTLLPFSTNIENDGRANPYYPSLERIDDNGAYSLENCCVIGCRCNILKDLLVDKMISTSIKGEDDCLILQQMILHMSEDRMKKLREEYTLDNFLLQYSVIDGRIEEIMRKKEEDMEKEFDTCDKQALHHINSIVNEPLEDTPAKDRDCSSLPEDVYVAKDYAFYCSVFHDAGMKVDLTFSQFKSAYSKKVCALTGERLFGTKPILISDWNKGFVKGNFMIVSPLMEKAMTDLMKTTHMSMSELADMFKRVK
ncbi:hypothetical protein [Escherichia coli]|uniref:hypothetical protein n=1 Tax=Escherichia coli TaxID=562 RepID=UPI0018E5842A|nr:hypothetical protein [Escherichia coli]